MVDDDTALVKMLSSYFSLKGYQVCSAADGTGAIECIRVKLDIILLDINMPGMIIF